MADEKRTSIPCDSDTRDDLKELKDERGQDWDSFLRDIVAEMDSDASNSNQFTYDDAKEACRAAIREELPDHQFP